MSGGSFEYLYTKYGAELVQAEEFVGDMVLQLEALGSTRAAEDTKAVLNAIDKIEVSQGLRKVWHDVEWWQSCDYSKEQAEASVRKYDDVPPNGFFDAGAIDALQEQINTLKADLQDLREDLADTPVVIPRKEEIAPCKERCTILECSCLCRNQHDPNKPMRVHRCNEGHAWWTRTDPTPEWRQRVDEQHYEISGCRSTPLGDVLACLSQVDNDLDRLSALARIVAVCEAQVGNGWQAERSGAFGACMSVRCLMKEGWTPDGRPNWRRLANAAATWLCDIITEGGAA